MVEPMAPAPTSSPRERGSSALLRESRTVEGVVPARAGVIRPRSTREPGAVCRPRASGGHPFGHDTAMSQDESSPRERGSSEMDRLAVNQSAVVPARAGVIRGGGRVVILPACRPRASGGHPDRRDAILRHMASSPRERGSSEGAA